MTAVSGRQAGQEPTIEEASTGWADGSHLAQVVFELAPDGMAITDEFGRIMLVNRRFEELFGFTRDQLVGHTVEMLVPERLRARHRHHRRDYEEDPSSRPMGTGLEVWARHRDGTEFLVEIGLSPASTRAGLRTIMAVRALSEPRSADAGDEADRAERHPVGPELDTWVIQPIFRASIGLHGLLDGATPAQLAALHPAIAELENAIRATHRIVLRHDHHPGTDCDPTSGPDDDQEDRPPRPVHDAVVEYFIDADDVLVAVDDGWAAFARDNDAPELAEPSSNRQLWSYIDDDEVTELWKLLVEQVRAKHAEAHIPFRCDAPAMRRWFEMTVTPCHNGVVRFRSLNTFEQPRPAIPLLDLHAERDPTTPPIPLCSWCGQVHDGTRWMDLEDLVQEHRLLERARVPTISHGSCPTCRDRMAVALSPVGRTS